MSRFIDVQPGLQAVPETLVVRVGDVLRFMATGGLIRSGTALELIGIFTESVVGTDGSVLTPSGPPNSVIFRALAPGLSVIDIVSGGPGQPGPRLTLTVWVEDGSG